MPKNVLTPIAERLWSKAEPEPNSGCWLWMGATILSRTRSYGVLGVGRRGDGLALAHRVSYELSIGPIAPGLFVLHKCDNPRCVNPAHLYAGTSKQNRRDCISRGRWINPSSARTRCPKGHAYDKANTGTSSRGRRRCRACARAQAKATA